ncbi:uncharacterized protein LOC133931358 [Phragmites australis]|uniref:uncharacterized protein LOC133931358 n=1 Tax=Phragmites australis TaxID=29695 RepID=UPI002D79B62F|nr:uncharacterized protein LOC133931358 [Phragmites australis]
MALEGFLTALVFCEAPLEDAYGMSVTTGVRFTAAPRPVDVSKLAAVEAKEAKSRSPQRRPEYAPALDGLNCFETVVMHRGSH